MKEIRDFIYVDKDWVNSIYSQINEGVSEAIVSSYAANKAYKDTTKAIIKGEEIESSAEESSNITENKVLYDYIYNELETKLGKNIYVPNNVNKENYQKEFKNHFLIKIKGKVKIHNYERMKMYLEEFNNIGEVIGRSVYNQQKEVDINGEMSGKQMYDERRSFEKFLRDNDFCRDKKDLDGLKKMIEIFNNNGFEMLLEDSENCFRYRTIINKKFLRLEPELLRILYTQNPMEEWTIVGQITYFKTDKDEDEKVEPLGLRDSYNNMINVAAGLENTFFDSQSVTEITIKPLAIYKQQDIEI